MSGILCSVPTNAHAYEHKREFKKKCPKIVPISAHTAYKLFLHMLFIKVYFIPTFILRVVNQKNNLKSSNRKQNSVIN
jgi:hypothetical protein